MKLVKKNSEYEKAYVPYNLEELKKLYDTTEPACFDEIFWQDIAIRLGKTMQAVRRKFIRLGLPAKRITITNCSICGKSPTTSPVTVIVKYLGICNRCATKERRKEAKQWPEE